MIPFNTRPQRNADIQFEENIEVPRGLQSALVGDSTFNQHNALVQFASAVNPFDEETRETFTFDKKITPEIANEKYGIEGKLDFKLPITERFANVKRQKILKQEIANEYLNRAAQTNNAGDNALNLLVGLGALSTDPLNFINPRGPIGAIYAAVKKTRFAKPVSIALRNPVLRGGIGGVTGNIAGLPISYIQSGDLGEEYGYGDAALDIAAGGVFGSALGAAKLGIKGPGLAALREQRAAQRAFLRGMDQKTLGNILSIADSASTVGGEIGVDLVQAMAKLADEVDGRPIRNNFYQGDYVYRTNFDKLTPGNRAIVADTVFNKQLIPDSEFSSFGRVYNLFENQPHRITEINPILGKIVKATGTREGAIDFNSLNNILSELHGGELNTANVKAILQENTGVVQVSKRNKIAATDAFELFSRIKETMRRKGIGAKATSDPLDLLKDLQTTLRDKGNLLDTGFETFKKKFLSLKAAIDQRADLRGIDLFDFEKLPVEDKKLLTDYLRFFQIADVDDEILSNLLKGKGDAIKEIFESAKMNTLLKDTITPEQATTVATNSLRNTLEEVQPIELTNQFAGYKNVDNFIMDERFMDEQLKYLETKAGDDANIKALDEALDEQVKVEIDEVMEANKRAVICVRGNS